MRLTVPSLEADATRTGPERETANSVTSSSCCPATNTPCTGASTRHSNGLSALNPPGGANCPAWFTSMEIKYFPTPTTRKSCRHMSRAIIPSILVKLMARMLMVVRLSIYEA